MPSSCWALSEYRRVLCSHQVRADAMFWRVTEGAMPIEELGAEEAEVGWGCRREGQDQVRSGSNLKGLSRQTLKYNRISRCGRGGMRVEQLTKCRSQVLHMSQLEAETMYGLQSPRSPVKNRGHVAPICNAIKAQAAMSRKHSIL